MQITYFKDSTEIDNVVAEIDGKYHVWAFRCYEGQKRFEDMGVECHTVEINGVQYGVGFSDVDPLVEQFERVGALPVTDTGVVVALGVAIQRWVGNKVEENGQ